MFASVQAMSLTATNPRYLAIKNRDHSRDGGFFYAVVTTGVFCYPSCAAKTPRPEHVEIFATAAAATQAGFRACKRCRADQPPPAHREVAWVTKLCRHIEAATTPPTLVQLAELAGKHPSHVRRVFVKTTGLTPRAYATQVRAKRLRAQLSGQVDVSRALHQAGFGSDSRLYAHANKILGMKPRAYRSGTAEEAITFAVGQCSLGAFLVASTTTGVCEISLGDDPQRLLEEFMQRFGGSELRGSDPEFERRVALVVGLLDEPTRSPGQLPLDIRGTIFQRRVWDALTKIKPGTRATYGEIAAAIGRPKAARAVARACATNRLAVAIPCHRVVRCDGRVSGYRWGIERKRELLTREQNV